MCVALGADDKKDVKKKAGDTGLGVRNATEVPLGSGLADAAKLSIMDRRERIRKAVEGE